MDIVSIAIFKSFINRNSLLRPFIGKYNQSRKATKLPESIEKFLTETSPEDVILSSMATFYINETFGCDFWMNTNDNWNDFYKKQYEKRMESDSKLLTMEGFFLMLRQNWDAEKPYIFEDLKAARYRYGLGNVDIEKEEEELDELSFVDIEKINCSKLPDSSISINIKHSGRVTFSPDSSFIIRDMKFTFARLAKTKDGNAVISLNREEGIKLTNLESDKYNVTINSKILCSKLKEMLKFDDTYEIFETEVIPSSSNKYYHFKILSK